VPEVRTHGWGSPLPGTPVRLPLGGGSGAGPAGKPVGAAPETSTTRFGRRSAHKADAGWFERPVSTGTSGPESAVRSGAEPAPAWWAEPHRSNPMWPEGGRCRTARQNRERRPCRLAPSPSRNSAGGSAFARLLAGWLPGGPRFRLRPAVQFPADVAREHRWPGFGRSSRLPAERLPLWTSACSASAGRCRMGCARLPGPAVHQRRATLPTARAGVNAGRPSGRSPASGPPSGAAVEARLGPSGPVVHETAKGRARHPRPGGSPPEGHRAPRQVRLTVDSRPIRTFPGPSQPSGTRSRDSFGPSGPAP
jgi:hypothetical protein